MMNNMILVFTCINGFQYDGQEDRRPCLSREIWLQSGQAGTPVLLSIL